MHALQSTTLPYPRHNIVFFRPLKMMRTGPMLDAIRRYGFVWAFLADGVELAKFIVEKCLEELEEVRTANGRAHLLEELGDLESVVQLAVRHFQLELPTVTSMLVLPDALEILRLIQEGSTLEEIKPLLATFLSQVLNTAEDFYIRPQKLERHELDAARLLKNQQKGEFLGWYVEVLALPKDDEWVPEFRRKFPVIHAALPSLELALDQDTILAHSKKTVTPQG